MALGSHEISAKFRVTAKKLGQNLTVQIDRQNFCMSREFVGGATLTTEKVKRKRGSVPLLLQNWTCYRNLDLVVRGHF